MLTMKIRPIKSAAYALQALCPHLLALGETPLKQAPQQVCPECVALGDNWVHLRTCQQCGHVGCCDDSKNQHARQHFHATQHPVVTSAEPGEHWAFCYPDQALAAY